MLCFTWSKAIWIRTTFELLRTYKIGNTGINAKFVFPYIPSFLLFFINTIFIMFVNVKLDTSGKRRIIFQACTLHLVNF